MACTVITFEHVKLAYVNKPGGDDAQQTYTVEVRRVSEEAQIVIMNKKDVHLKCALTGDSENCRAGSLSYFIHVHGENNIILTFSSSNDLKQFQTLVDFRDDSKSIFDKRTAASSAVQYFQFYGYLSQQQNMMQDYVRTGTYQKAMVQNFVNFRDKVVLDVGAGSGILSFFAMQAGARKVYAVEASTMAEHTKKLVSCSQYAGRIQVIPGKIEEIKLPEQVDVIISEPMGYMLFNERMLETYLHAKKFLKQPGGLMFPTIGDLHVAPFSDELLYMEQFTKANFWYQQSFHGVDLSPLRDAAVEEYFKQPIVDTFDIRILMAKSVKYTVNFLTAQEEDLHRIEIPLHFTAHSSGTVHGFAFWFDIAFIGTISTVWLSTAPTESLTHWYQVRCLFRSPLFIKAGETMLGKVVLRSNKRQSYDVDIEAMVEATGCKAENTLDLKNPFFHYTGQPPAVPAGAHTSSPSEQHCSGVSNESMMGGGGGGSNTSYPSTPSYAGSGGAMPHQQQNDAHAHHVPHHHHNSAYQSQQQQSAPPHNMRDTPQHGNQQNGINAHCNAVPLLSASMTYPGTPKMQGSGDQQQATPQQVNTNLSFY